MPSSNVIARLTGVSSAGQGRNAIPLITPALTSATIVLDATGQPATLNVGGNLLSGTSALASGFDGFGFRLRAVGKAITTASATLTVAIVQGNTSTYSSSNVLGTTLNYTVNGSTNFIIECTLLWDSQTQYINGYQLGQIGNQVNATSALINDVLVSTQSGLQFGIAVTCSSAGAGTFGIAELVAETL